MVLRADKGKATKLESEQTYIQKEENQIQQGDYKKERKSENTLLENIRKKLKAELVKMGYKTLKEQKDFSSHLHTLLKRIFYAKFIKSNRFTIQHE